MVQPGTLLDSRYRLDSRIAAGGMGEVWQGTDQVLERHVAVKLLRSEYAADAEGPARFRNEARHAGLLSHPNICQVFDYSDGGTDGQPYLVMELVDGPSLARVLADGPLGPAHAMAVTAQVCAGLAAAHANGLVHRDIKPANLLITKDGLVKITDFGIAHAVGTAPVTRTGMVIGTWAYLAPERAAGNPAGPATDLYSLGVVAYECLTGKAPFEGEPLAIALAHRDQTLPPLPDGVPDGVAALVADLTAKDPADRPASAVEVATRAEQLRAGLAGTEPTRPDLPVLAAAIVSTGPQPHLGAGTLAGASQSEATRMVADLGRSATVAGEAGGGDGPPTTPGARRGLLGPRMRIGLAVAVVVLAGLVAWALVMRGQAPSHARLSARTPAARPSHHHHHHKPTPSAVATAPAVVPTSPASPTPSASPTRTHSHSPTPSPSPTPSATTPSGTPSPTGTPTASATTATTTGSPGTSSQA
ncbi:MAG: serine/threonine protein kinase [Actinobacteria bacterium]|nr:serine/threonine protein kinase [Actinomycetota bacterium]